MKNIFFLLLIFVFTNLGYSKSMEAQQISLSDLVYQNLDQDLMKIWLLGKNKSDAKLNEKFLSCQNEWKFTKAKLSKLEIPHVDVSEFNDDVDYFFKLLFTSIDLKDYLNIEKMAYHILYEFRFLRQCYFYSNYVLDQLWDVIDAYQEIYFTIDDPMMVLKEWSEFEDLINSMICNWENYEYLHISEINKFYPGMNKRQHAKVKEDVNSCTFSLLKAFTVDQIYYLISDFLLLISYL